jgi:hypothetical protein
MSAIIAIRSEIEGRGYEFGRELGAALVLAGDRAGRDRALMHEMTAVAANEMRKSAEWLRECALPEKLIAEYDSACREGFRTALHAGMQDWQPETQAEAAQQAA